MAECKKCGGLSGTHAFSCPNRLPSHMATAPIEGTIVEQRGLRVKDLIEKLSEMNPEAFVLTNDCCYGIDYEVSVYTHTLDAYDSMVMERLGIKVTTECVMID